jgi:arabinofuranosyltransferase
MLTRLPMRLFIALAVPLAVLALHAAHYLPFIADDALISLRYADRLLAGHGLTWTAGEPVEGYSNLLWLLACAGLGALGIDLIDAVRILGLAGMGGAIVALAWAFRSPAATLGGGLFFALSGPIAVWAIGGLEQPFVAAGLAWTLALLARAGPEPWPRAALKAGLPLAAVCLTRPDGPLFTIVFAGCLVVLGGLGRRRAWKAAIAFGLPSAVAVAGQLAFRLAYYGEWVPNTALLKAAQSRLDEGLTWVGDGLLALIPLLVCANLGLLAAVRRPEHRAVVVPALAGGVAWCLYVASVGGDIFPAWRHMVPLITLLAFPTAVGFLSLSEGLQRGQRLAVGALSALVLAAFAQGQLADEQNQRGLTERWEWDGLVIGHLLRDAFGDRDPYLAVTAAGCVPYFSGLRALDMQGLNDKHIARQPPVAKAMIAHDHGDGAYVLEKKPDLMIFGGARGGPPKFVSGSQMRNMPAFRTGYRMVRFAGHKPHKAVSEPWIRLDGKLGIEVRPERITVPGYLFEGAVGVPTMGRGLKAGFIRGAQAAGPMVTVPSGHWRVEVDPPDAPVTITGRGLVDGVITGPTRVALTVNVLEGTTINSVVLRP